MLPEIRFYQDRPGPSRARGHVNELGSTYQEDAWDMAANMDAWSMYILWDTGRKLEKAKIPTPPDAGSIQAFEWLDRMLFLVSDSGLFQALDLSFAETVARQEEKKKLYRDFWGPVPVTWMLWSSGPSPSSSSSTSSAWLRT